MTVFPSYASNCHCDFHGVEDTSWQEAPWLLGRRGSILSTLSIINAVKAVYVRILVGLEETIG